MRDLTGYGRNDLLTAFGFDVGVATAAPGARMDDFGSEFTRAGLELQFAVGRWRHADFKGLPIKQNGNCVGSDLDGIDGQGPAIQRHAPAGSIALEFDDVVF